MVLPNLFIPGAGKSGTSSLHDYLSSHPEIFMSASKEPHFFSEDKNFGEHAQEKLLEYQALFLAGTACKIRGESSTGYMVFPNVIERIQKHVERPKFIFLLRNPVDRLFSHYWWLRGRGIESRPLYEVVKSDMHQLPDASNAIKYFPGYRYYYQFGRYGHWLNHFYESFLEDQILIITTEMLKTSTKTVLDQCFDYLNVSRLDAVQTIRSNETVIYSHPGLYRAVSVLGFNARLSKLIKKVIPEKSLRQLFYFRQKALDKLGNAIQTQEKYPQLSNEERDWLISLYQTDVALLRNITGLPFADWATDFPG